jgi:oligopeptide/dipeptide ABC transporter ATP-binding protein
MTEKELLQVENLKKHFHSNGGWFSSGSPTYAVDDVSFSVNESEVVGIVGESGCGKSTLGQTILQLEEPTEGKVFFDGTELTNLGTRELNRRRRDMQLIFQDSASSLNPRLKVGRIVDEPLREHTSMNREERRNRVAELLEEVDLQPEHADKFPHSFSGGQRQRINVARALTLNPRLIIADEPMSALDLSVQAQLIQLFKRLQREYEITMVLITHDMSVVRNLTDRTFVMYLGKFVERGPTQDVFNDPKHPYTEALLSAITTPGQQEDNRIVLEGDVPDPSDPPQGCPFHTRCHRYIGDVCKTDAEPCKRGSQTVNCHLYDEGQTLGLESIEQK